jgi:hypothetical protein
MSLSTIYINLKGRIVEKIIGAVPTENNYTDAEKEKLAGLSGGTLTPEQLAAIAALIPPTDITGKVDKNTAITGAIKTKITYDTKGLVTAGTDATTADIADSTNKRYVTDTQLSNSHAPNSDNQDLSGFQVTSAKGAANGYAPLDASSKVPIANLPDTILGSVNYHGTFSAAGGINPTVSPLALQGDYFVISVGGTISTVVYAIGDWIIYNGTTWERVDNSDKVSSVNGSQGAVVLNQDNIGDGATYKQYSDTEKTKLAGVAVNANNYSHPANHPPSIITQDASNRFVTDTEKSTWNGKVATTVTVNAKALSSNIVLTPDDLDDAATTHKFATGTNTGDETAARIATIVTGAGAQATPLDADEFPFYKIVGTILSKVTWANIKATLKVVEDGLYNPKRLFTNLAAAVVTSGATEKVLLQLQIPAARAVIGSTFRAWVVGNSSSTGTLIFRIKCGPNGSISDTEDWKSVTSAAQAANARAGFECLITVRSATTIAVDGVGYAGAVQLPTTIAVPATPAITISGIWYINMTVVCSVGTFTAQVGSIEEIR